MFESIFGYLREREISKYLPIVNKINKLEGKNRNFTDEELRDLTFKFIKETAGNEDPTYLLNEAFAVAREASYRILHLRHFDVQIIGGLVLHEGKIAEMKTGEGKTLVAILPSYLNALKKNSVHVITVNDYLASRDSEYVGQVHRFLGLTVGLIQQQMTLMERQVNYSKDITYVTNTELGFDYLKDNMVNHIENLVQTPFYFSIVDEIDSILIDEARTPLIISKSGKIATEKYKKATNLVMTLLKNTDYEIDEKSKHISLTEKGITKSETWLNSIDLFDKENSWASYIFNALRAQEFFKKNVHYIIKENEILIVDEFTGRVMAGRRWSNGLHQAIESKEGINIQNESETLSSISYQNFFLVYPKLSGMTGTAKTEEIELENIYGLKVVCIPTHRKMVRKDLTDILFKNQDSKWKAVAVECLKMYSKGRPTLIGTTSIEKSELLSSLLQELKIPHNLLNAKPENTQREAEIISQAGRIGSITISTNMAGRGTDILLGGNPTYMAKIVLKIFYKCMQTNNNIEEYTNEEKFIKLYKHLKPTLNNIKKNHVQIDTFLQIACESVLTDHPQNSLLKALYKVILKISTKITSKERKKVTRLGGLYVIGTERHESRRIDDQLRGRAGRQGDPGSSRFFLSLDDTLLRVFGDKNVMKMIESLLFDKNTALESNLIRKTLESAQKQVENYNYETRKQLFEYDEVLNYQRQVIYFERKSILESNDLSPWILDCTCAIISDYLSTYIKEKNKSHEKLNKALDQIEILLDIENQFDRNALYKFTPTELEKILHIQTHMIYEVKELQLGLIGNGLMDQFEKSIALQTIDSAWQKHLLEIEDLRENIGWRSYGQKNPLIEYKNEAYNIFLYMTKKIKQSIVTSIFKFNFTSQLNKLDRNID